MRSAWIVLGALVAAWLAAAAFLFVWPREDAVPGHADAVVVLAGDSGHRLPGGLRLVRRGIAPTLVLSREPRRWRTGLRLCSAGGDGFRVVCFRADPYSTRGEARAVARLARQHGWRSLVVVTSGYHVTRARTLFRRCFAGRVAVTGVGYDRRWLPLDLALETAKLVRAETTSRGC